MKKKQIVVFLLIFTFLNIASLAILMTNATAVTNKEPLLNEPLRIGSKIRDADYGINEGVVANGKGSAKGKGSSSSETPEIVDTKEWLSLDDYNGYYFFTFYDLWRVGNGTTAEVWIQSDLSWLDPDPQGRSTPEITEEQVIALLGEFETWIVPTDETYFGSPDPHDGSNSLLEAWGYFPEGYYSGDKNVILVSNVRDDNYYTDFPYYIAGFYSPSFEGYFDRNIISIDSYQWEERVGPDGDRPYLYEGVIAHEYQHLIHDDYFTPNYDATFMNEGCSMYAEILCEYPTAWGDINSFLATPDNSLTEWGDQGGINILADYGAAMLWATYLNDVVSHTFLQEYIQAGRDYNSVYAGGIDLLNYLLGQPGYDTDFETMFKEWQLANLMKTGYTSFDLNDREADDVRVHELKEKWPTDAYGSDFGNTITVLDYDTGISGVGAYGTDYILLSKLQWQSKYASELHFDGDDVVDVPHWVYDGESWYSTPGGAYSYLELFLDVDLVGDTMADPADLSIVTSYNIEPEWDYGFVQIWNVTRWETLNDTGDYCTMDHDPDADPNIVANLPGLTGDSGGVITVEFDLTPYKGLNTQVRFLYMTDPAVNFPGWWIDTVIFKGEAVDDADLYIPPPPTTSFIVTVIRQDFWDGEYYYTPLDVFDVSGDNMFILDLAVYLEPLDDIRKPDVLLVITPRLGVADYKFSVVPI